MLYFIYSFEFRYVLCIFLFSSIKGEYVLGERTDNFCKNNIEQAKRTKGLWVIRILS